MKTLKRIKNIEKRFISDINLLKRMTSSVQIRTSMAWTNQKVRLSCVENIGLRQLWKMIVLDNNNNKNKNTIVLDSENLPDFLSKRDIHLLPTNKMSLMKFLAINALELSAPAAPVLIQGNQKTSTWVQLSGHPESIVPTMTGIVRKRVSGRDDTEVRAYEALIADNSASKLIPRYYGFKQSPDNVSIEGYIELQDLLSGFKDPNVMDIKMGCRTFLECEVNNKTLRPDLYNKMVNVDCNAPTVEENKNQAITKLRYMTFREEMSSSHTKGFRIEALRIRGGPPVKDLKRIRTSSQIHSTISHFLNNHKTVTKELLKRLNSMRTLMEKSEFFRTHEIVGSSLFIVYDDEKVGAWLIDFAKSQELPDGISVDHRKTWTPGNYEEGILNGMDNLIEIFEHVYETQSKSVDLRKCNQR